jgi:predicted hydrocarbon binding protein
VPYLIFHRKRNLAKRGAKFLLLINLAYYAEKVIYIGYPMKTDSKVRQILFSMFKRYFQEVLGTVAFQRFVSLLPSNERMIFAQDPSDDGWINARSFSVILAAVDIHITNQVADFGFEMGKYFVSTFGGELFLTDLNESPDETSNKYEQCINTGELEKMGLEELRLYSASQIFNIAKIVKIYGQNLNKWFTPLEVEVDEKISSKSFSILLGTRPVIIPLFCELFMGILVGFLDNLKVGDATITKQCCILDGDDTCHYEIFLDDRPVSGGLDFL